MKKRVVPTPFIVLYVLVVLLILPAFSLIGAAQTSINTAIKYLPPSAGHEMFVSYCAACHGREGAGNGPAAKSMKIPPTDLTTLTQRNGGKFPHMYVASVIRVGAVTPHGGPSDMPVWGTLFGTLTGGQGPEQREMRIRNLTDYVKSLQKN